jgi:hypothetical protein
MLYIVQLHCTISYYTGSIEPERCNNAGFFFGVTILDT